MTNKFRDALTIEQDNLLYKLYGEPYNVNNLNDYADKYEKKELAEMQDPNCDKDKKMLYELFGTSIREELFYRCMPIQLPDMNCDNKDSNNDAA